jgi:hypothetical protein
MVESFMRALRQGNVWGAAWRTVPMFFEAVRSRSWIGGCRG